ncbi:hypothetical protein C7271_12465, partial [filamentous cyanobacterium CCP5]
MAVAEDFNYEEHDADPQAASEAPDTAALSEEEAVGYYRRKSRWYAVQVASGCEKRVKLNLCLLYTS